MATYTNKTKSYFRPERNPNNPNNGTDEKGSDKTEAESDNDGKLRKFFEAIKNGNVGEVRRLLDEHKIDVNTACLPDETHKTSDSEEDLRKSGRGNDYVDLHANLPGNSALHLSASSGQDDICQVLIEDGKADVNVRNHKGDTPLHCAARGSHEQTCQLLMQNENISLNLKNDVGDRPLHLAAANGSVEVCRILIQDRKVNVDARNKIRSTPLHRAVDANHVDVCQMLIKEGKANVNLENDWGTPLHKAAGHDHTEISRSVNIGCDCTEICRILIRDGNADVNIRNKFGDTPLYKAAYKKNVEACRILIEDGHAKVNLWNKVRDSPLHAAAEQNCAEICRLLIKDGKAHVNMVNKVGNTPLHCAFKSGRTHAEVAKVLLEVGDADTELKNKDGQTALDYKIVGKRNSEIIKTAIKNVTNHKKLIVQEDSADRVKLFMCGNPGAGKTTLVNSLTKGFWSSLMSSKEASSTTESYCPTPGIQVKSKHIKGAGEFSIWDMAGQVESHLTHSMFLSKTKGIFVSVYDTTDQSTKEQLHYWLRFLKAGRNAADTKPEVVIVGTHLDQQGNTDYALRDAKSLLDDLVEQYSEFLNIHKEYIVLDARQSGSHIDVLRSTLKGLSQPLRDELTPKPRICRKIIKSMGQWYRADFPLLTWNEFEENVKASIDCLADDDLIKKSAGCLHEAGKLFLAKLVDHEDMLILDVNWLTSKIFAPIFGKHDRGLPNPGLREQKEYTKKELMDQIEMDDPELATALLKHFELAYSYLRDDDEIFVIPAKLPADVSFIDWTPDPCKRYTGICIECKDRTDMFAIDVFPCVQVSLMKRYHQPGKEPNLSHHGIKVMDEVEGMVQLNEPRTAIHVAVREIVGLNQDAAKQLMEMKQIVLDEIERRSGGTETEESYLSPKEMSGSQHLLVHRFSEQEVVQADAENKSLCGPTLNQEMACCVKGCLGDGDYEYIDWPPQENSSSYHRSGTGNSRYQKNSHQQSLTRRLNMIIPVPTQQNCHSCLHRRDRNTSLPTHVLQDHVLQYTQTRQHSRSLPPSPGQYHGQLFHTRRAITHVNSANDILTHVEEQQEYGCLYRQQSAPSFNTPVPGFYCHPQMQGSLQHLLESSRNPLLKSQDHLACNSCRPSCGWECIPQDIQSKIYQLLDTEHPLGRDYRAMAEVLAHTQEDVRRIKSYQIRDIYVSAAIIKVAYMRRRIQRRDHLTIHEMWTIIKHPGIVGSEETAKLIEDFLADNGYMEPWTPCKLAFGVEDEVLLHRAILRQTQDIIRQYVKASDIINALEGPLTGDDIQEIRRCEGDHVWNHRLAVDLLLNKLLQLQDVRWYPMFCEAASEMGWALVLEVLAQAESELRSHPAFASLANGGGRLALEDTDRTMGVPNADAQQNSVFNPCYNPGYSEA